MDIDNAIARAERWSPFLAGSMARHPDVTAAARDKYVDAAIARSAQNLPDEFAARWRHARTRLTLALALGDLAGLIPLEAVVTQLSDFADRALSAAIAEAISRHVPGAPSVGFVALALGKHGSRELNYSSDIDPIFLYDPATLPHRAREDAGEAASRIARTIVDLLQTRDGDGFVFRVDLRLRPASEATPLALPVDAAIAHYESSALTWERAAFVRARAASGDIALGESFLNAVSPFVWRRSLDFGAVAELRALTARIRSHHGRTAFGPGYDVKRGRGGIREVEFFAQVLQLIHGGRDPSLRTRATMDALAALVRAGWIEAGEADTLSAAYRALRTAEHRLQLVDDRQTHMIPGGEALDGVAALDGCASGNEWLERLRPHVDAVTARYQAVDSIERAAPLAAEALTARFAAAGFADPDGASGQVLRLRSGASRAIRSPTAVTAFEAALPELIDAFGRAPDPAAAFARFDRLVGRLPSGVNLFRLLDGAPHVRGLLVDVLSHAPTLADALAQRPALLDRLVDQSALGPLPNVEQLVTELSGPDALSSEALLDRVRLHVAEHRFALGTQIVEGGVDPLDVGAGYARLAEAAVEVVTTRTIGDFRRAHGDLPRSEFTILALGRLGGGLLTHASDLDLVYLMSGTGEGDSDGARPLGASLYANRLGQRVTAALSAPTSVGPLYDVDTRLRPSGAQGPLVVPLDAFDRYGRESAWTWEHMALCRARPLFGSAAARCAVATSVAHILRQPRDRAKLLRDARTMRTDMALHKPAQGPLDVKLGAGGLVDLEFTVHVLQLSTGTGLVPDLRLALAELAPELVAPHDLLNRLLIVLRLVAPDLGLPAEASRPVVARACGAASWEALLAMLADARQSVSRAWAALGD